MGSDMDFGWRYNRIIWVIMRVDLKVEEKLEYDHGEIVE